MRDHWLIIPVEIQVRELDAKLLLACVAARRGYTSVIGWRGHIDQRIASFPRSVYFLKSLTQRNLKMARILQRLGHKLIAWDEEAVVHYKPEIYYNRRLCEGALRCVDDLIAWGPDNENLFRDAPNFPGTPIHVLGNPRSDLLRKELRAFFDEKVRKLKSRYGDFILVNSNFGTVNGYIPSLNFCVDDPRAPKGLALARGSEGMPDDFARRLYQHRREIFSSFKALLPRLAAANPRKTIILRPHPAENHSPWYAIAAAHDNIQVVTEGNVVPWIMACQALIHHGCTTAVEAFVLDVPTLSYEARVNEEYDNHLPNALSRRCFSFEELQAGLDSILAGDQDLGETKAAQQALIAKFWSALDGLLACERIVDLLDGLQMETDTPGRSSSREHLLGMVQANWRWIKKIWHVVSGRERYSPAYMRHRYPKRSIEEIREVVARLLMLKGLGDNDGRPSVKIEQLGSDMFKVSPARADLPGPVSRGNGQARIRDGQPLDVRSATGPLPAGSEDAERRNERQTRMEEA